MLESLEMALAHASEQGEEEDRRLEIQYGVQSSRRAQEALRDLLRVR